MIDMRQSHSLHFTLATIASACIVSACVAPESMREHDDEFTESDSATEEASTDDELDGATSATSGEPELSDQGAEELVSDPDVTLVRYCSKNNDCHDTCTCYLGQCEPELWGPPPPQYLCDQPPVRACSSGADCQSGCTCSGGTCQDDGFGPPSNSCHMPPLDAYESDNVWQSWKPYLGASQAHNFHQAGDNDWVAVYFGSAGTIRFRTYGLTMGTDTRIEVYAYTGGSKGALVAAHDDIGGAWWIADSKSSRVDVAVPANSSYLVRVVDKSNVSIYSDSYEFPSYMLQITYK